MTSLISIPLRYLYAGMLLLGLLTSACKKNYIDKINPVAGDTIQVSGHTQIAAFKVKEFSPDTVLNATIAGDSIIVYWPSYKPMPATVKPEIILPDSARISPASGAEIPFEDGVSYTVTAQSKAQRTYHLYIDFRQPEPWFENLSMSNARVNQIAGDWFMPDKTHTKVYLIAADKQEYETEVVDASTNVISVVVPKTVPVGQLYDVRVVNGIYTLYNRNPAKRNAIKVTTSTFPAVWRFSIPAAIKQGERFTLRGSSLTGALKVVLLVGDSFTEIPLEIVAVNDEGHIEVRIPDTVPAGRYDQIAVYFSAEGWNGLNAYTSTFSLQVNPK